MSHMPGSNPSYYDDEGGPSSNYYDNDMYGVGSSSSSSSSSSSLAPYEGPSSSSSAASSSAATRNPTRLSAHRTVLLNRSNTTESDNPVKSAFNALKEMLQLELEEHIQEKRAFMNFQDTEELIDSLLIEGADLFSLQPNCEQIMHSLQIQLNETARIVLEEYDAKVMATLKDVVRENGLAQMTDGILEGRLKKSDDIKLACQRFTERLWIGAEFFPTDRVKRKVMDYLQREVYEPSCELLLETEANLRRQRTVQLLQQNSSRAAASHISYPSSAGSFSSTIAATSPPLSPVQSGEGVMNAMAALSLGSGSQDSALTVDPKASSLFNVSVPVFQTPDLPLSNPHAPSQVSLYNSRSSSIPTVSSPLSTIAPQLPIPAHNSGFATGLSLSTNGTLIPIPDANAPTPIPFGTGTSLDSAGYPPSAGSSFAYPSHGSFSSNGIPSSIPYVAPTPPSSAPVFPVANRSTSSVMIPSPRTSASTAPIPLSHSPISNKRTASGAVTGPSSSSSSSSHAIYSSPPQSPSTHQTPPIPPVPTSIPEAPPRAMTIAQRLDNITQDVKLLKGAMYATKADNATLVQILGTREPKMMYDIARHFQATFGLNLAESLRERTFNEFSRLVEGLCSTSLGEFDVACVMEACSGIVIDKAALVEIFAGRTNEELSEMKQAYLDLKPSSTLTSFVVSKAGTNLGELFTIILQTKRDEGNTITTEPTQTAGKLHAFMTSGQKPTHQASHPSIKELIEMLCLLSYDHIRVASMVYASTFGQKYGTKLSEDLVKVKGLSTDAKDVLSAIVRWAEDAPLYVAHLYSTALKGNANLQITLNMGLLIRLGVRFRRKDFAKKVRHCYWNLTESELTKKIDSKLKGDFRDLMMRCVEGM
ncbi:Annexin A3 [Phlyctochytrium planicorne]|nr:Annexin A3 [Phlyctochytrium planicorne]